MGAQEQRGNLRPLESPEWMRSTAREVEYHLNISISLYIYNTYNIYIDMCYYCHYWYHYYFCHYVIVSKIMCSSNMFFFKKKIEIDIVIHDSNLGQPTG